MVKNSSLPDALLHPHDGFPAAQPPLAEMQAEIAVVLEYLDAIFRPDIDVIAEELRDGAADGLGQQRRGWPPDRRWAEGGISLDGLARTGPASSSPGPVPTAKPSLAKAAQPFACPDRHRRLASGDCTAQRRPAEPLGSDYRAARGMSTQPAAIDKRELMPDNKKIVPCPNRAGTVHGSESRQVAAARKRLAS